MNSKKAKELRKLVGGNEAAYENQGSAPMFQYHNGLHIKVAPGTPRTLYRNCTRGQYKNLKNKHKGKRVCH